MQEGPLIEYTGTSEDFTVRGPSKRSYIFGNNRFHRMQRVHPDDAAFILSKSYFRRMDEGEIPQEAPDIMHAAPVPKRPKPVPQPVQAQPEPPKVEEKEPQPKPEPVEQKSEDDAKAVIKELDNGAVFSDVAKAKSTGPTGPDGGDLGWFKAGQMVPPFAQALTQMQKGTYSKAPVQTQFGWHVILLEDTRKATPPKFEDVKPQLANMMRGQQINAYIQNLRKNAKVDLK